MTAVRPPVPRVLSIAGTDPTGGAGAEADLKSIMAAGGYGLSVITALVAQNTRGVRAIHTPDVEFLHAQLDAVSDDVTLDAIKTGMLGSVDIIETITAWLEDHPVDVLVVDPVMVATSGDRLLEREAEDAMRRFAERATVITPNIPELAVLTGSSEAANEEQAIAQARRFAERTGVAVIVKAGHLTGPQAGNVWVGPDATIVRVPSSRLDTSNTHGTGCSLSSALATRLVIDSSPGEALAWVTGWLHESIRHGAGLQVGEGHGPVDHGHRARRMAAAAATRPWPHLRVDAGAADRPHQIVDWFAAVPAPAPGVPAAGPWTDALWQAGGAIWAQIRELDFIEDLGSGTLTETDFTAYLDQDAWYLEDYSRALAAVASRAANPKAQAFWAGSAANSVEVEAELHRSWLSGRERAGAPSPVTSGYTNFLRAVATGDPYVVGAAAVLPCFWLYCEVGRQLGTQNRDDHPYRSWLDTYQDESFLKATAEAIGLVEDALAHASPAARTAAARAYLNACVFEREFFDQASRR